LTQLNGRVLIPTNIYKIVFDPRMNMGAAYYVKNEAGKDCQVLSISELEKIAGINFFPNLPVSVKDQKLDLPVPSK
jgi:endonuclease G